MTWEIEWTSPALKDAGRLDNQMRERIVVAVERFATTGQGDVKQLRGTGEREWRLRVGEWRVRFTYVIEPDPDDITQYRRVIRILRVLPRGRAYRE